ncbi:MAG: hypothetical protein AB8B96_13735 [Lysobacterales bacterium]
MAIAMEIHAAAYRLLPCIYENVCLKSIVDRPSQMKSNLRSLRIFLATVLLFLTCLPDQLFKVIRQVLPLPGNEYRTTRASGNTLPAMASEAFVSLLADSFAAMGITLSGNVPAQIFSVRPLHVKELY